MKIQKRWSRGAVVLGAAAIALAAAGCSDGSGLNGPQGVDDTSVPIAAPAPANPLPMGGSDEAGDSAADEASAELAAQQAEKARLEQTIAELGKQIEELKAARSQEREDDDEEDDNRGTDRRIARLQEQLDEAQAELEMKQDMINAWREGIARLREENRGLREEVRQSAAAEPQTRETSPPDESAPPSEPEELLRDAYVVVNFLEIWDVADDLDGSGIDSTGYPNKEADFLCVLFFTEATFIAQGSGLTKWSADYHNEGDSCEDIEYKNCRIPLDLADGFTCYDLGPCDEDYEQCNVGPRPVAVAKGTAKVEDVTRFAVLMNDEGGDDPDATVEISLQNSKHVSIKSSMSGVYSPDGMGLYWSTMR